MHWNYRIINNAGYYAIHECYYDDNGKPESITKEAISPGGIDIDDLKLCIEHITEALNKPILNYEDFTK